MVTWRTSAREWVGGSHIGFSHKEWRIGKYIWVGSLKCENGPQNWNLWEKKEVGKCSGWIDLAVNSWSLASIGQRQDDYVLRLTRRTDWMTQRTDLSQGIIRHTELMSCVRLVVCVTKTNGGVWEVCLSCFWQIDLSRSAHDLSNEGVGDLVRGLQMVFLWEAVVLQQLTVSNKCQRGLNVIGIGQRRQI